MHLGSCLEGCGPASKAGRFVRDEEVVSSSLATPTMYCIYYEKFPCSYVKFWTTRGFDLGSSAKLILQNVAIQPSFLTKNGELFISGF